MKRKLNSMMSLLVFAFSFTAARATETLPSPEVETLPNGLQVAWFIDPKLPIVDLALLVKSGNRDDPAGKSGCAELTADLLQRGSAGLTPKEISRRIESLGATSYSEAEDDATSVGVHGLSQDADRLLELLSILALRPDFKTSEFKRSQKMLAEYWNHVGDSADRLADFVFSRTITNGSTYSRANSVGPIESARVSEADIRSFYRRNFTPKNAILAVVGRVNRDSFRKLLLQGFGNWKGEAPVRKYIAYKDPRFGMKEPTIWVVDRKDLPQAQIRIGFSIPGIQAPNRYALAVANALTGEYFGSRLNSVIRDELGLAYGVNSTLNYGKEKSFMMISSATQAENSGRLVLEVLNILGSIKRGGVSESEVTTAKEYLVGSYPLSVSTLGAVATRWLSGVVYNLGPGFLNEYIPRVRTVSHREVVTAVDEGYRLKERVVVIAGDAAKITASLIAGGFTDMKTLNPAQLKKR